MEAFIINGWLLIEFVVSLVEFAFSLAEIADLFSEVGSKFSRNPLTFPKKEGCYPDFTAILLIKVNHFVTWQLPQMQQFQRDLEHAILRVST